MLPDYRYTTNIQKSKQHGIGLLFSFLVVSLPGFGIRVMVASQNEFENIPPSSVLESFEKMRH